MRTTKVDGSSWSTEEKNSFRTTIHSFFREHARTFPWRETTNPYHILVSEIMLQQTQTERVEGKYERFLETFPDVSALAGADLNSLLGLWQGLGYNRRAIALKAIAEKVLNEFQGRLPETENELVALPGIGKATAGAILAFAFNKPAVFIETNIRRVFIHFFFQDQVDIKDAQILPLVEKTLDRKDPRQWYYALMDYGAMLKKHVPNPNKKSAHYARQARFEGSNRQLRGMILKKLVGDGPLGEKELLQALEKDPEQIIKNLVDLEKEGFISRIAGFVKIA